MGHLTYEQLAARSEATDAKSQIKRMAVANTMRLLHASMGLTTEVGEFADALKRHIYYGQPVDVPNLIEEMGDIFWYLATAANTIGVSFNEIQQANIDKLRIRYPEKFTHQQAKNRNLATEQQSIKDMRSKDNNDGE